VNTVVNINKLKGKIVEQGMTIEELARIIGVNKSTLYRKIQNKGETITIKEANLICKALNLSGEEVIAIFFSDHVVKQGSACPVRGQS